MIRSSRLSMVSLPSMKASISIYGISRLSFTAVRLTDDQILGYVYQTSGQVTRVSGTQSRIGQTLTGSMGGDEVLQYVQTFTEVGLDRKLDGMTGGIGHQSSHTGQLLDLLIRASGTGVSHHEDVVVLIQACQQVVSQLIVGLPSRSRSLLCNAPPR